LSKVVLTHHTLKNQGQAAMTSDADGSYKLPPMDAVGSGSVQEKQQAYLDEIIQKVNGLFEGELTDDDQLVYVNGVLKGKLLENEMLMQQAASNSKEQFANSPDLKDALMHAIMDALEAHTTMSTQALGSRAGAASWKLKDIAAAAEGRRSCTDEALLPHWLNHSQEAHLSSIWG
jgi:type I restriction enzyme R subunit